MKNIVFILKTSLKILKAGILPVLLVMVLMLTFGQIATAQNEPFRIKGKEAKEYLIDKYKLKKSQVRSEIQQTTNGPKGKLYFVRDMGRGSTLKVPMTSDIKDRENRAREIAKSFLKEEADLFGITDINEMREMRISTSKGHDGDYTMVRYHRFINDLQFDNAYIWVNIGSDESITVVQAELVPASPELYEAVKKKTLSEAEIQKIVEKDVESIGRDSKDMRILHVLKFAIASHPYVIWSVNVNFKKGLGRLGYTIDAFTGEILTKKDILIR